MEKIFKILIGIDISEHSIKAVKVEKAGEETHILDFAIRQTAKKGAEGVSNVEIIKEMLGSLGLESAQVNLVISGEDVVVKHSIVPFMPKDELRDAVRWSLKEAVNFNLDESALDFQILATITGTDGIKRNEILAVAVSKALIDSHVKLLQSAGVELSSITVSHFALANLIYQNERSLSGKTNVLIDIGFDTTTILIFKGSSLEFVRKITPAGNSFTKALSGVVVTFPQKIELDAIKAEEVKVKCGIPSKSEVGTSLEGIPLNQVSVLIRPVLERLLADIRGSFKYFRDEFHVESVDQIFLSGGGASLKNLVDFVKDGLGGISTQLISLPSNITPKTQEGKDLANKLPALAVAIGACLVKEDAINLLPKSAKIQKTIGIQQKVLQSGAIIVGVVLVFSIITMKIKADRYQRILIAYNDYYSSLVKLRSLRDGIMERRKFFNEIIGSEMNLYAFLKELSRVVPKSIEFSHLKFNKEEKIFFIEGLVYTSDKSSEDALAGFLLDLENSAYFSGVNLISSKRDSKDELEFARFSLTVNLGNIK